MCVHVCSCTKKKVHTHVCACVFMYFFLCIWFCNYFNNISWVSFQDTLSIFALFLLPIV